MGAVLACGNDALLSHQSAAALWGFPAQREAPGVDVTTLRAPEREPRRDSRVHLTRVAFTLTIVSTPLRRASRSPLSPGPSLISPKSSRPTQLQRAFEEALPPGS